MVDVAAATIVIIAVLVIDFIWIGYVNTSMYQQTIASIQKSPLTIDIKAALLSYGLVMVAIFYVALPLIDHKRTKYPRRNIYELCMIYGGLVGLVVYGVYNITSQATLKNYPWTTSIVDTLWGTGLFMFACCLYYFVSKNLKR